MTSKRELLTTIERQKEQILKYESKLKDVVRAYKGLLKEKEALEAGLSALTPAPESESGATKSTESNASNQQTDAAEGQPKEEGQNDDTASTSSEVAINTTDELWKKVTTLTTALSTVTMERNRIESSFQNDKKRLLAEKEKLEKGLQETLTSKQLAETSSEAKLQDLKSRLIVAQHERDQDTQTTAVMLRELESKLALERSEREKLETALEDAHQMSQQPPISLRPSEHYEKKINDLQNELEQVRSRLKRAEQQSQEPPILRKIQGQMEDMRLQHKEAIDQERIRAAAVEETARDLAQSHEERVATLEAHLAELSLTVASYDRTRQEDLQAIQKLKEKVAELAQENTSLVSRLGPDSENNDNDISSLCRRLTKLKDQLIHANINARQPVDIESLLSGGENVHVRCQQEYDQLKEEFERYKIISRQQTVSNTGESACKGDCAKQQEDLRHKVRSLTSAAQLAADSHSQQVSSLRQELVSVRGAHESQVRRMEIDHRATVAAMEQQLSMQQQRSLNTLTERDNEIQRLNQKLHEQNKTISQNGLGSYEAAAAALLSQVSGGTDGPLLHHLEELARKDQEIMQLRREKKQVETTMREVQMAALVRQQAQQETIEVLEEEVERRRRNSSREGENLEYLKNVVLQYMTSSDADSRQLMLNAIAAVLKFTHKEVESVKKYNALWWWQPAPKSNQAAKTLR